MHKKMQGKRDLQKKLERKRTGKSILAENDKKTGLKLFLDGELGIDTKDRNTHLDLPTDTSHGMNNQFLRANERKAKTDTTED